MALLAALGLTGAGALMCLSNPGEYPEDTSSSTDSAFSTEGERSALRTTLDALADVSELSSDEAADEAALQAASSIERVLGELGDVGAFEREGAVPEVAGGILEDYRDGGAELFEATYLDYLGRAWGCVVADAGWVDICCVRELEGGRCLVEVVRLDAQTWERALASDPS